jgi:hypothetical protein
MVILYIGFVCCVFGLISASIPHAAPLYRVVISLLSLVGLGAIVPAIVLRRRLFVSPQVRGSVGAGASRPGRGPLYWILVLLAGGIGLVVLVAILAVVLSFGLPAIQRIQQKERPDARPVAGTMAQADEANPVATGTGLRSVGPRLQPAPAASPPWFQMSGFGPVREVTLTGMGEDPTRFFDLDAGRIPSQGPEAESSPEEEAAWRRDHGIDLVGTTTITPEAVVGFDMVAIPVSNQEWDITAPRMAELLLGTSLRDLAVMQAGPNASPATYVFQTREGSRGVLEVTRIDVEADPPTITLRYKLAERGNS